jgi:hypothetical protein
MPRTTSSAARAQLPDSSGLTILQFTDDDARLPTNRRLPGVVISSPRMRRFVLRILSRNDET